jgi:hypothetical protein
MAGHDSITARRELVKRLVLAELLARPGCGPLALRLAGPRARVGSAPAERTEAREPAGEGET